MIGKIHRSVLQDWVMELPFMQQSSILSAIRGADGVDKNHNSKTLVKFLRRSVLISAFDGHALNDPVHEGGGSFTGPSVTLAECAVANCWESPMMAVLTAFLKSQDNLPLHYWLHIIHAVEVIGYKHPDSRVRQFWHMSYHRMCHDMHMHVETLAELDTRLNDNGEQWKADETRLKK